MQTHQIVRDEAKLKEFIEWLPELNADEVFFLCLQARKKYMPSLKSHDKTQLKRFVSTKSRLFDKIRQLECPIGSYVTTDGTTIEDEGMALYITLNPRDMRKATFASIKALVDLVQCVDKKELNPHSEVLSQIHKTKSRSAFVHFDIDTNEIYDISEIYDNCVTLVGPKAVEIVITRGGFHVLIAPDKVVSATKNWYPVLHKFLVCDQVGDLMLPVVGCCHGGFVPHFYKR